MPGFAATKHARELSRRLVENVQISRHTHGLKVPPTSRLKYQLLVPQTRLQNVPVVGWLKSNSGLLLGSWLAQVSRHHQLLHRLINM